MLKCLLIVGTIATPVLGASPADLIVCSGASTQNGVLLFGQPIVGRVSSQLGEQVNIGWVFTYTRQQPVSLDPLGFQGTVFNVRVLSYRGSRYALEISKDLRSWITLDPVTGNGDWLILGHAPDLGTSSYLFYRVAKY